MPLAKRTTMNTGSSSGFEELSAGDWNDLFDSLDNHQQNNNTAAKSNNENYRQRSQPPAPPSNEPSGVTANKATTPPRPGVTKTVFIPKLSPQQKQALSNQLPSHNHPVSYATTPQASNKPPPPQPPMVTQQTQQQQQQPLLTQDVNTTRIALTPNLPKLSQVPSSPPGVAKTIKLVPKITKQQPPLSSSTTSPTKAWPVPTQSGLLQAETQQQQQQPQPPPQPQQQNLVQPMPSEAGQSPAGPPPKAQTTPQRTPTNHQVAPQSEQLEKLLNSNDLYSFLQDQFKDDISKVLFNTNRNYS